MEGKPWWGPEEALLPRMGGSSPDGVPSLAFLIGPGPQPGLCTPWGHVGDLRLKAASLSCQVPLRPRASHPYPAVLRPWQVWPPLPRPSPLSHVVSTQADPPSDSWVLPLSRALSHQQPQLPPHSGPFFCRQPPTGQGWVLCLPACPGKGCVRGLRGPQGSQSPGAPGTGPVRLAHQALEKCQLN